MNLRSLRLVCVGCIIFTLLLSTQDVVADVSEFQVDSTDLQLYRDGIVRITHTLIINETLPAVTFSILGSLVDNFIVLDENRTVLDYEIDGTNLSVFSLGATCVSVQYDTTSLTAKSAEEWTFLVDTPYNLTVLLPVDSTIIYFNQVPNSIESEGNQIALSLFEGIWEISYVFPIIPFPSFQVSHLQISPNDGSTGDEITITVIVTNEGSETGSFTIPFSVNEKLEETKTVTLDQGESTKVEFKVNKDELGTYNVDIAGLVGGFTITEIPSNGTESKSFPVEYLVLIAVSVTILITTFFLFRRRKYNPENIFKVNPRLNQEEKDVIQFLVDNDGKAFEAEIRQKFSDIPRTSLWRLIKRLEKMGLVSIKKIGLENRVELKK
jgi:uncharacterized membrane protein